MTVGEPRAVAVSLTKGGVGKTARNQSRRPAPAAWSDILVDIDPAGNATEGVRPMPGLGDHIGTYLKDRHG